MNALKNTNNYNKRPSKAFLNLENAKKGYNEVILLNKDNPNYDPTKAESNENSQLIPIMDGQGINETPCHQSISNLKPSLRKKAKAWKEKSPSQNSIMRCSRR